MTSETKHSLIRRDEMLKAVLEIGGQPLDLSEYATTGLVAVGVGPRGCGKTNVGQLIGEQLAEQGWVTVIFDPEGEMELMYGDAVKDEEELYQCLERRDRKIVVVRATDAAEFVPYGQVILDAADRFRKPLFVVIDEGQLFSASRKRSESIGEAADIINEFVGRGRKRALDLYVTALRYTGSIHRLIFANKNLTFIGCQEDAAAWSALAPQFKDSGIDFGDLSALAPGEFFCISRRGIEKVKTPMAEALKCVAPAAKAARRALPATFSQWDRAMRGISTERLGALSEPVMTLLGKVAGLSQTQMLAGQSALQDELEVR
ncbi:ATP-binding protein [Variovorax sp. ZS18.2.2]|uniref:ATP-binding protein n=1 Tax=Variovorax sp. ZS18.2.2 TaxID=2971255 RepID=UPI002151CDE6|nr:ATP-binding protein [Variovorax sp. ZS18.2.2]MCR6481025.1 ATP-binding protein [Variovorax sp. ZS18.2.2]